MKSKLIKRPSIRYRGESKVSCNMMLVLRKSTKGGGFQSELLITEARRVRPE